MSRIIAKKENNQRILLIRFGVSLRLVEAVCITRFTHTLHAFSILMKNKKKIKLKANTLTHAQADAITHTHELEIRWKKQPQNEQCVRRM